MSNTPSRSTLNASISLGKARHSEIWGHFTKSSDEFARCNHCSNQLSVRNKSTSAMRKHLSTKHPSAHDQLKKSEATKKAGQEPTLSDKKLATQQSEIGRFTRNVNSGTQVVMWKPDSLNQRDANKALIRFIAQDIQPISVVEDAGFIAYTAHLQPAYKLPCRKTVRSLIDPEVKKMYEFISKQTTPATTALTGILYLSFTSDIWSNQHSHHSFISMSCHWISADWKLRRCVLAGRNFPERHTGRQITEILRGILKERGIVKDQHNLLVRDGASNMVDGIAGLMDGVQCTIHLLQLVVRDAVLLQTGVARLVLKCKQLVAFLHRSPRAYEQFRKKQAEHRRIPLTQTLKVKLDVETRWNSTFLMLQRIQDLKESIVLYLSEDRDCKVEFSNFDWDLMAQIIKVLEPFYEVTNMMSANAIGLTSVIVIILRLKYELQDLDARLVGTIRDELADKLDQRFFAVVPNPKSSVTNLMTVDIMSDPAYTIPCLLNPVFRNNVFFGRELSDVKEDFINAVVEFDKIEEAAKEKAVGEAEAATQARSLLEDSNTSAPGESIQISDEEDDPISMVLTRDPLPRSASVDVAMPSTSTPNPTPPTPIPMTPSPVPRKKSWLSFLDKRRVEAGLAASANSPGRHVTRRELIEAEVEVYFNMQWVVDDEHSHSWKNNIAPFWQNKKEKLPILTSFARKRLAAPCSSVYSERLFSEFGNIYEAKRSRLEPELAEKLLILHHNYPLIDEFNA